MAKRGEMPQGRVPSDALPEPEVWSSQELAQVFPNGFQGADAHRPRCAAGRVAEHTKSLQMHWRSDMGVEPTQDGITAPQTVLKTATVTGPRAAPLGGTIFARS